MAPFFQTHLGEIAAMGTALMWTFSALAWTSAGRQIGAMAVSFNRLVMAFFFLTCYCKISFGAWIPDASFEAWKTLLISGVLGFFLADLCIFKAFLIIGPRLTLLLQALTPPLVAVVDRIWLHHALGWQNWLGMAVTLSGVVWVVLEQPESPKEKHHRKDFFRGVLLAIGSAVFAGVGYLLSMQGVRGDGSGALDPFAATLIRVIGGLILYFPLFTLLGRWWQIGKSALHRRALIICLFGAFVGPFLGVAMNMKALELCSPGVVATIIATTPVLILPFVIFLYREKVSPRAAIGAVISVVGVGLLLSARDNDQGTNDKNLPLAASQETSRKFEP
jgi:drug/metabolite transporter (DMT)-like permease